MNKNQNPAVDQIVKYAADLVTSVDPYAHGKQDGDQFVKDVLDLIAAAAQLNPAHLTFNADLDAIRAQITRD